MCIRDSVRTPHSAVRAAPRCHRPSHRIRSSGPPFLRSRLPAISCQPYGPGRQPDRYEGPDSVAWRTQPNPNPSFTRRGSRTCRIPELADRVTDPSREHAEVRCVLAPRDQADVDLVLTADDRHVEPETVIHRTEWVQGDESRAGEVERHRGSRDVGDEQAVS